MSAALAVRWESACARLGVKPRQFAVLLAVTAVAVTALGVKGALKGNRAPKAAAAAAAAPAAAARGALPERGPVVELSLEARPARDPFRPFFLLADAETAVPAAAGSAGTAAGDALAAGATAAAPAGLQLRAVIAGELAVIGEQTVGVGDEVTDGDGRRFTVEEIQERRVVLREGGRRTELGYSQAARAAAAKGGRK